MIAWYQKAVASRAKLQCKLRCASSPMIEVALGYLQLTAMHPNASPVIPVVAHLHDLAMDEVSSSQPSRAAQVQLRVGHELR